MTRVLTLAGSSLAAIGLAVALVPAMPVAADEVSDTLVIGMTVGIDNPNIWAVNSTSEWSAVTLQYDMMLKFSDDDLSAAPRLGPVKSETMCCGVTERRSLRAILPSPTAS